MSGSTWRERERRGRSPFEIAPEEAIVGTSRSSAALAASSVAAGPVLLGEREHAEDAAHPGRPLVLMDVRADGVEVGAGVAGPRQQRDRGRRRPRRPVGVVDAVPAARRPHMLAQQLAGLGREHADVQIGPLHLDALADPAGRRE